MLKDNLARQVQAQASAWCVLVVLAAGEFLK
jgi:hypothetical protein